MFKMKKKNDGHKKSNKEHQKENSSSEIFTYFIPAPPTRPMGYREKDFDTICKTIISHDLKLKILKTVPHQNGLWVMILISGQADKIARLFTNSKLKELSIDSNLGLDEDNFQELIERD